MKKIKSRELHNSMSPFSHWIGIKLNNHGKINAALKIAPYPFTNQQGYLEKDLRVFRMMHVKIKDS